MRPPLLLIIVCILLTTCRHTLPQDKTVLARAESIIDTHPDSAIHLLKKITNQNKLSPSDKALYALLMSKLLDMNGQYIESDSLIRIAVDYYSSNKEAGRAGYAFFYLSRCERNRGNAQGQANALLKAIPFANKSHDNKLLGYIYGEKATIYEAQQDNDLKDKGTSVYESKQRDSMLYYHKLSFKSFKKAGDRHNYVISLIDIGYSYYLCHQYDSALYYCQLSGKEAILLHDHVLLSTIYRLTEGIYYYQKNYREALHFIRLSMGTNDVYDYSKWKLITMIYLQTGQLDSAAFYLNKYSISGKEPADC
jgi:hypothetical protein